jgi:hypothetical protein
VGSVGHLSLVAPATSILTAKRWSSRTLVPETSWNSGDLMECPLVTSLTALDEPGDRSPALGFAKDDRRAPSRVAVGDESPMNSHESREDGF